MLTYIKSKIFTKNNLIRPKLDFYIQTPHVWGSLKTVWEACKQRSDLVDTQLVRLPFYHIDEALENSAKEYFESKKISFVDWVDYDLIERKPDLAFIQNPYEETRPEMFRTDALIKLGVKLAYVPYCLEIYAGETNNYHFNLLLQKKCFQIFVRSEEHKNMFKKYCENYNDEKITVTGHPKFDDLLKHRIKKNKETIFNKIKKQRVVLWNPHFSVHPDQGFSTFLEYKEIIFNEIKGKEGLFLLIRPHPLLFKSLEMYHLMDPEEISTWKEKINSQTNMLIDETGDYKDAFAHSHAMISDASSLALEYLYTKKPILFTFNRDKNLLNEDKYILDYLYNVSSAKDIGSFVDLVCSGKDPMYKKRIKILPLFMYKTDGKAGVRIRNHILAKLK